MAISLNNLNFAVAPTGELESLPGLPQERAETIFGCSGDFDGDRMRLVYRHLMKGNKRGKRRAKAKHTTSIQNTWSYYV